MDARFRFFRKGNDGAIRISPEVDFATKSAWLGASKVMFENSTNQLIEFEDTDAAIEASSPKQKHQVPAKTTVAFDIAQSVDPANVYGFKITSHQIYEGTGRVLAANPEIIITG